MKLSRVAADLRPATRRMPAVPANMFGVRLMRAAIGLMRPPRLQTVTVSAHELDGVGLRVYTPAVLRSDAAVFWIHGGGLVLGSMVQDEAGCADVAERHGVIVVSADYRLAPEHPFPAAIDDCHAAWEWFLETAADLGVDPSRVVVGGQSAGGGLAAALVQRIHDSDWIQPLAQWLFCPMLDDRTAVDRSLDSVKHRVWNNRANRTGWGGYLGPLLGVERLPDYAAPGRREDLSGLPPTWIGVGDIELFFDEDLRYAQRLAAAGVEVVVDIVPGAPHGFESWARNTATARSYLDRANEWLGAHLVAAGS